MTRNLDGEVVLVAGASGVLGSLLAKALHGLGANLLIAGRDVERLAAAAEAMTGAVPSRLDFREPETLDQTVDLAIEHFGRLDGVVNAAGVVAFGPLADMTREQLMEVMTVDLVGPLDLVRTALPHLDGGFIVNITGVVAETPVGGMSTYSAAKAGLSAASMALKRELRRRKVTVVDARPPHIETGLASRPVSGQAPEFPEGLMPAAAVGRIVEAIVAGESSLGSDAFVK